MFQDFSTYSVADGLGINGSVATNGRIIALNSYHAEHGYVTLTSTPPFVEADRYDSQKVRRYRTRLVTQEGFGYRFNVESRRTEVNPPQGMIPNIHLTFDNGAYADCTTFAVSGGVIQLWDCYQIRPTWTGWVSIQRCAYTQITEGGPLTPVASNTEVMVIDSVLVISNPALPHAVAILGLPLDDLSLIKHPDFEMVNITLSGPAGRSALIYAVGETPVLAIQRAWQIAESDAEAELQRQIETWQKRWRYVPKIRMVRRGLSYSAAMAIPVDEGVCLLTDHMLLPLSWNRDAYYAARALLSWHVDMQEIVRRHLLWTFEQTERINGAWGRCYLANGKIKDGAFQLDQQLFPLLELAEYILETGDQATYDRLRHHIQPTMDMLLSRRHPTPDGLLLPTDETPADDPIHYPYHLSSHLLLWRVLKALHTLTNDLQWFGLAAEAETAIQRYFVTTHDNDRLFAYATDAQRHYHFYHDANDLPLVLAPLWDLMKVDDPVWRSTLRFAFSERNKGGYTDGHLGSVHTPGLWSLGELQALIAADLTGDREAAAQAWRTLWHAAQPPTDGLPEAIEPIARHWFAWPNAALAWYMLQYRVKLLQLL